MRLGLRAKFFAGMFAIVLLLGATMVAVVETMVERKLTLALQQRGVAIARHIASGAVDPVLTERFFQLKLMLHQLAEDNDLLYIFVTDPAGLVLAHTFSAGFPRELVKANRISVGPDGVGIRELTTEQGAIIDIAVPLLRGTLGEVRVGLSEEQVQGDVREIVNLLLWLIGGVLVVGWAAAVIFDLLITRPILRLLAVVKAVERGEEKRSDLRTSDEIGSLGRAFDRMVAKRSRSEQQKEELIAELQIALDEINALQGIIPICASCKKIRDDQGYWGQVESFIRKHTRVDLSHGICPECAEKLYPQFYKKE